MFVIAIKSRSQKRRYGLIPNIRYGAIAENKPNIIAVIIA